MFKNKIDAIKAVRDIGRGGGKATLESVEGNPGIYQIVQTEVTTLGLKDAKDLVEAIMDLGAATILAAGLGIPFHLLIEALSELPQEQRNRLLRPTPEDLRRKSHVSICDCPACSRLPRN
jgi:hypothetical protein